MAFSKVKVGGLADDSVTAANIDDDGTGYTVGNLTNSGTLQQTGQVTLGSGGTNWSLPTARGTDKYVLQINGTTGASDWAESLTAPEISGHNFDVSGSTDDGGINAYEAPYEYTGTTNETTTISSLSSTTGLLAGQYISGAGIPADTTIVSVNSGASTMVISNAVTVAGTQTGVALKIQKTPGEKNGGKVTLTGANFGATIGEITVAITDSGGAVIANASYLSGLTGGNTITAEWTGTEGTYSTDLTSSYTDPIYFKITKSGLSSNVHNTNTTLTSDPAVTALSGSSQTGGDVFTDPSATSLGAYGSGRTAGGGQDSNTKVLLNFDRGGGTDIEDSSNIGGDGHKVTATNQAVIKASPFGDGKTAMYFDGSDDSLSVASTINAELDALGTGAFTVELWVNFSNITSEEGLFNFSIPGNNNGAGLQIAYRGDYNPKGFNVMVAGTQKTVNFDAQIGTWYHLALCRSASGGTVRFFIDGVQKPENGSGSGGQASGTGSFSWTASGDLDIAWDQRYIGRLAHSAGLYFEGYIDEVRVSNTERYATNFDVSTSRFVDDSNTLLLIHSNQSYNEADNKILPSVNGVTFSTTNGRSAWGGSNWLFDGTNDYVTFPPNDDFVFGTGDFTIEAWLYSTDWSHTTYINWFDFRDADADSDAFWLGFQGSAATPGKLYMYHNNQNNFLSSSAVFSTGGWHHLAVVRNGGTITAYVDGTATGTTYNIGTSTNLSGKNTVYLSRFFSSNNYFFEGHMEDIRITKGLAVYTGNFTAPTGQLTKTWDSNNLGGYANLTNIASNTDSSKVKLLIHGNHAKFTDSGDASGTAHNITPTGSFHSEGHGAIAPALTWPASLKKNGSAGVYFDGNGDVLTVSPAPVIPTGNNVKTVEAWVYSTGVDSGDYQYVWYGGSSGNGNAFGLMLPNDGSNNTIASQHDGSSYDKFSSIATTSIANKWVHFAQVYDGTNIRLYLNGKNIVNEALSLTTGSGVLYIGGPASPPNTTQSFRGYIANLRVSSSVEYSGTNSSSDWSNYLGSSGTTAWNQPTKIYGAFGQDTPDVGTITLTATGDGDFTWSEVAGGTALPGTLAVGSTTHSGSGNSRTHTATITGKLPTNTSTTFTNGVRGDTATNNILLKVQHDTDATKAVTLNGVTGMGITQKSTEKPVLFNARRYLGNQLAREHSGYGFQPDFIWVKNRDNTISHMLVDSVRGLSGTGGGAILSDSNAAADGNERITGITSDGYQHYKSGNYTYTNTTDVAYISWAWKAGGAPTATNDNTSGAMDANSVSVNGTLQSSYTPSGSPSIYPKKMSVNTAGGFSVTLYSGYSTSANAEATVPHGLDGTPDFVFIKNLNNANVWIVRGPGFADNECLHLNSSDDKQVGATLDSAYGQIKTADTNLVTLRGGSNGPDNVGKTGWDYIMYAWKAVSGVSAFGTYTGNGTSSSPGTQTINTAFRPRFVMIKPYTATGSWSMWDSFRTFASGDLKELYANGDGAEPTSVTSTYLISLENTGFKFTNIYHQSLNSSSVSYIYMAFA